MDESLTAFKLQQQVGKIITNGPSPFANWLSPKLTGFERGKVTLEFFLKKELTNPVGSIHGGAAAGMMDELIGCAIVSLNPENYFTTLNLQVDFLFPAMLGETLIGESFVIKEGKRIILIEGRLTSKETGKLIARGSANLIDIGKKWKDLRKENNKNGKDQ